MYIEKKVISVAYTFSIRLTNLKTTKQFLLRYGKMELFYGNYARRFFIIIKHRIIRIALNVFRNIVSATGEWIKLYITL